MLQHNYHKNIVEPFKTSTITTKKQTTKKEFNKLGLRNTQI